MSPQAAKILAEEILPIVRGTVPRAVRPLQAEDSAELIQDTLATAAIMLDAAEREGKLPPARSIAFYAIQRMKSGRRSYGGSGLNPLSAGFCRSSASSMLSLDVLLAPAQADEGRTLADMLADSKADPATECARRLDWQSFSSSLDKRSRFVFRKAAAGMPGKEIARRLGVSSACVSQMKVALAGKAREFFGVDALSALAGQPEWRRRLRAHYEARAFEGLLSSAHSPEAAA